MNSALEKGFGYRRALNGLLAAGWLAALIVAIDLGGPLQVLFGVPLVLFLPGALVGYALLPPTHEVAGALRGVLAVALSVAASIAVGLLLALCFDRVSPAAAGFGLALVGTAGWALARRGAGTAEQVRLPRVLPVPKPVAIVTALLAVGCLAIGVAALNVSNLPGHFTALTVSPSAAGARVEVRSHEGAETSYRYVVRDQDARPLRSGTIELDGGETETLDFAVPARTHAISVALYVGGAEPYRLVTLRGLN